MGEPTMPDGDVAAPSTAAVKQVLLIEDNPGDVQLLTQAVAEFGAPVHLVSVSTIESALAILRRDPGAASGAKPHVILLDLNLPAVNGMVGIDLIKLTEDWQDIPIIVLSSSTRPRDREECRRRGASDYWVKPTEYIGFLQYAQKIAALPFP